MPSNSASVPGCPIDGLLQIVGDRWSLLILRDAFYGVRRFDGFQQHLGISKKILAQRLRSLTDAGILNRVMYRERPKRFEYRLAARGLDMFPILLSMSRWGTRWLAEPGKEWLQLRHTGCGHLTEARLVCSHCGELLTPARVKPLAGPGAEKHDIENLAKAVKKSSPRSGPSGSGPAS